MLDTPSATIPSHAASIFKPLSVIPIPLSSIAGGRDSSASGRCGNRIINPSTVAAAPARMTGPSA